MDHFGRSWSRLIYFAGRKIPAAELHRLGVVSARAPRAELMNEATTIAREIAAKNPRGCVAIKRGFQIAEGFPHTMPIGMNRPSPTICPRPTRLGKCRRHSWRSARSTIKTADRLQPPRRPLSRFPKGRPQA
ncbi:hypothetical protein ACSBOB_32460 [Mesorhizobium sp. ASY16-5R]|uniref:hypothetical protein n=1 Tax=Mesorhizobium sp. ASY16-5R TaxID=3445772 RepID=UPI003F9EFC76